MKLGAHLGVIVTLAAPALAQWAEPPIFDDPLDVASGSFVLDATPNINPGPDPAFGANLGGPEPGTCFFPDVGLGNIAYIELATPQTTLSGINVYAKNDGSSFSFRRAMQRFTLLADTDGDGSFETVAVEQQIDPDYDADPNNQALSAEYLELHLTFAAVTASTWRCEFEQGAAIGSFEGIRIIEVDGVGGGDCACAAHLTGDTCATNTNDFFAFLALYQAQDPAADFSPGGGINTNDFFAYLAAYQTDLNNPDCPG